MINGHGDDLYLYGDKVRYNFSSNICDKVDHRGLREFLFAESANIAHYPEPEAYTLEQRLADSSGVSIGNILVTNGVTEAIYLIAQVYRCAYSSILSPTFSEYGDACRANIHLIYNILDIDALVDHPSDNLVWICNPNNPTGTVIDKTALTKAITDNGDKIFIIDQAYEDYTTAQLFSDREAVDFGNVILFHSMTKRFSIPGLRIGYMVADKELIDNIKKFRAPWSVNSLAISAANYLLDHADDYSLPTATLLAESQRVATEFCALGITVIPSATNFMLCCLPSCTARELKAYLIENHGILIRDASNFEGLTDRHFRIAVQSSDENDLLIKAIKEWITSNTYCH